MVEKDKGNIRSGSILRAAQLELAVQVLRDSVEGPFAGSRAV